MRLFLFTQGFFFQLILFFLFTTSIVYANERHSDPDGCLSCHALTGLQFIDKEGLLRVSTIDESHYYSSLHGSVPCKDCHRKISHYPHKVENGYVDCAESCHVNEPSKGEAYTHKPIVEEFEKSAHGQGLVKDFAGGNRLKEELEEVNPSCRRCHANTAYIAEDQMEQFKTAFMHTETECGTCHQGDVWRDQFGGHILRRLVGSRWKKEGNNKMCIDCHANQERMAKVELEDPETHEKHKVDRRWIDATESYDRTLHSRILKTKIEAGASCLDCHAPTEKGKFRHNIYRDEDKLSATHPEKLAKTCAQSGCHEFANTPLNAGFVETDLHDVDQLQILNWLSLIDSERLESNWQRAFYIVGIVVIVFIFGAFIWLFTGIKAKKQAPILGNDSFEKIMIGRKIRKKPKKKPVVKKKSPPVVKPEVKVPPAIKPEVEASPIVKSEVNDNSIEKAESNSDKGKPSV